MTKIIANRCRSVRCWRLRIDPAAVTRH